jgi:hypothetical protein
MAVLHLNPAPPYVGWPTEDKTQGAVRNTKSIALSNSLKGKTIHVPNVEPYFDGWPMGEINTVYPELKHVVTAKIAR